MSVPGYWRQRRVLVTGATGMVGSVLIRRLLEAQADVVVLIRDLDSQSELVRSGCVKQVSIVNGRLEEYADLERAVLEHEVATLFHLGAQTIVGSAYRSPLPTFEANIRGTWHVLEVARRFPDLLSGVVVASSDKAYGEQADLPYREHHPLEGRAPYEVSKSCADLLTQCYAQTYGVPAAIARCGNVYGPGDLNWSRIVPGTICSLLLGQQPVLRSDGSYLRDYLYVEDVAAAYMLLGERLHDDAVQGTAFNFSDERPLSVMEMYEAVCRAADMPGVEPRVLNSAVGEIHDQYLDARRAREVLGWRVLWDLNEGLRATVAWYRDLLCSDPRQASTTSPVG